MNSALLLEHYAHIADAPDAVTRLRRFVLELAVRGKLVEQDESDEPVTSSLAKARKELMQQAESAARVRWKPTNAVKQEELSRELPPGWVAARVNDTGLYVNGLAFKPNDWKRKGKPIIRIQNLTNPFKDFNYTDGNFADEVIVRDGDILVSWSATLEAFRWSRGEGVLNQHIFRVIPAQTLTEQDFLLLLLRNAIREMAESEHAHGLVMSHINRGPFLNHIVFIPPISEQRRIAQKFAELITLCDQLETAREEREAQRNRMTAATLARLDAPDPETFPADARFAIDNFTPLTTRPDQITQLRQTILSLAVRGKLVEQDAGDEPASAAAVRIATAKEVLEKTGQIRRRKPLPPISSTEHPYALPSGWIWERLGNVANIAQGFAFASSNFSKSPKDGFPLIKIGDIGGDQPDTFIKGNPDLSYLVGSGELLLGLSGSIKCAVWRGPEALLNQRIAKLSPISEDMFSPWLHIAVNSCIEKWKLETSKLTVQNIKADQLHNSLIPLPPVAEQHRIVAKIDELMKLCDHLEASLIEGEQVQFRLLESVLLNSLEAA